MNPPNIEDITHLQRILDLVQEKENAMTCQAAIPKGKCRNPAIRSHSVSRGRELGPISKDRQVYGIDRKLSMMIKGNLPTVCPQNITSASIFPGFCDRHDSELFRVIDTQPWIESKQQLFLLGYRTLAWECITKRTTSEAVIPIIVKIAKSRKSNLDDFRKASESASKCLDQAMRRVNSRLREHDFTCYSEVVDLGSDFPLRVAGTFFPEYGFNTLPCFDLAKIGADLEPLCVSTMTGNNTVYGIFAWFRKRTEIQNFVDSFKILRKGDYRSGFIQICFEHFENMYFSMDWWDNLPSEKRKTMEDRIKISGSILEDRRPDYLTVQEPFIRV